MDGFREYFSAYTHEIKPMNSTSPVGCVIIPTELLNARYRAQIRQLRNSSNSSIKALLLLE
jgi:hypothetical protein